jgi:2-hydroxychromene-2-carboxylate isomerase
MAQIDYFFSVFSPWTYLAGDRLERIAEKHGAAITYKPLDVMALFDRTGGVRPAARHPSRLAYRKQELERWAAHLGMEMNLSPAGYPPNGAPASYVVIAAQQVRGGDVGALVRAILRAVWVENRNIGEDEVLREKLSQTGFDPKLVTSGLFIGAMAYEKNLEEAVDRGVFGAPFYIVRDTDQRFWGQDRLEMLDAHLGTL